jgi:hypothetical protein
MYPSLASLTPPLAQVAFATAETAARVNRIPTTADCKRRNKNVILCFRPENLNVADKRIKCSEFMTYKTHARYHVKFFPYHQNYLCPQDRQDVDTASVQKHWILTPHSYNKLQKCHEKKQLIFSFHNFSHILSLYPPWAEFLRSCHTGSQNKNSASPNILRQSN